MFNTLVIIGTTLWNTRHAAPVQIAEALGINHRVLYVEPFAYRSASHEPTEAERHHIHVSLSQHSAGVRVLSPALRILPLPSRYRSLLGGTVERINAGRMADEVEWALHTISAGGYELIFEEPSLRNNLLLDVLSPEAVYLLRWREWEQWATEEDRAVEKSFLRRCRAIFAMSEALSTLPRQHNSHSFNISGGLADRTSLPSSEVWESAARRIESVMNLLREESAPSTTPRAPKKSFFS